MRKQGCMVLILSSIIENDPMKIGHITKGVTRKAKHQESDCY